MSQRPCEYCRVLDEVPEEGWLASTVGWRAIAGPLRSEPGWVVIMADPHVDALSDLHDGALRELGPFLARVTAAVATAVSAERVYIFKVGESVSHVHFLLTPRSAETPVGHHGVAILSATAELSDSGAAERVARQIRGLLE